MNSKPFNLAKLRNPVRVRHAFTVLEIMVALALTSVIVFALMSMFNLTQKAFVENVTQADVMEDGRAALTLLRKEMSLISSSGFARVGKTNIFKDRLVDFNFYTQMNPSGSLSVRNSINTNTFQTNILQDVFFLSNVKKTWKGTGYLVGSFPIVGVPIGTLYRYSRTAHESLLNQEVLYGGFRKAQAANERRIARAVEFTNLPPVIGGVIHFAVKAYDSDGRLYTVQSNVTNQFQTIRVENPSYLPTGDYQYRFWNKKVPDYLEVELGVLSPDTFERLKLEPDQRRALLFLQRESANIHYFKQRIPIRTASR